MQKFVNRAKELDAGKTISFKRVFPRHRLWKAARWKNGAYRGIFEKTFGFLIFSCDRRIRNAEFELFQNAGCGVHGQRTFEVRRR